MSCRLSGDQLGLPGFVEADQDTLRSEVVRWIEAVSHAVAGDPALRRAHAVTADHRASSMPTRATGEGGAEVTNLELMAVLAAVVAVSERMA